jgi:hypothetical protein
MPHLRVVARRYKIAYSTAARWAAEVIRPIGHPRLRGKAIDLGAEELRLFATFAALRRGGLSIQRARAFIEDIRVLEFKSPSRRLFALVEPAKGRIVEIFRSEEKAAKAAQNNGQGFCLIRLRLPKPNSQDSPNAKDLD